MRIQSALLLVMLKIGCILEYLLFVTSNLFKNNLCIQSIYSKMRILTHNRIFLNIFFFYLTQKGDLIVTFKFHNQNFNEEPK